MTVPGEWFAYPGFANQHVARRVDERSLTIISDCGTIVSSTGATQPAADQPYCPRCETALSQLSTGVPPSTDHATI